MESFGTKTLVPIPRVHAKSRSWFHNKVIYTCAIHCTIYEFGPFPPQTPLRGHSRNAMKQREGVLDLMCQLDLGCKNDRSVPKSIIITSVTGIPIRQTKYPGMSPSDISKES